jgi:hypothetical protein
MHNGNVSGLLEKKKDNLPWTLRIKLAIDAANGV